MIRGSRPIGAAPGESIALEVRGSEVAEGAGLRFDDGRVRVEGLTLGKVEGDGVRSLQARVTVPPEARPGPTRFRVVSGGGVSNPGSILVGRPIPGVAEVEPNDRLRQPQRVAVPAAVEGSMATGDDVDVFGVEMKAGETLVAEAIAARAGSRLDALVTLLSPEGRELASNDDLFGRDAAAWATVPADGRYLVTIQDANGRHPNGGIERKTTRPYRLEIGRLTLVTLAFPAGVRRGRGAELRLQGANLPGTGRARLDPPFDSPLGDRPLAILGPFGPSNPLALRVGDFEEHDEAEPNGAVGDAPVVTVPAAINGTFDANAGGDDLDVFRLKAAPGREGDYAITAYAARVGSPADPVLTALDAKGDPRGEDDDALGRDARIVRRVDSGEGLIVSARDHYGRGGGRFVYRIEVEPVVKELAIAVDLGHRTVPRSGALALPVAIDRRGVEGPVTLLADGLPEGVAAPPITIEAGESRGLLILSAGADAPPGPFAPRFRVSDAMAPASFAFRERGPLDEVPREGDPQAGPRETTVDAVGPLLAVADRANLGISPPPGPIAIPGGGEARLTFAIDRRLGAEKRPVKVRLLAPGKALEGFEPAKALDLGAEATSATFLLKAKAGARARHVSLSARAWFDGAPEALGVDSTPVTVTVAE